jgi:hypothetical protein
MINELAKTALWQANRVFDLKVETEQNFEEYMHMQAKH